MDLHLPRAGLEDVQVDLVVQRGDDSVRASPNAAEGERLGETPGIVFLHQTVHAAFCEVVAGTGEIEFVSLWGEAVIGLVGLGLQKLGCE